MNILTAYYANTKTFTKVHLINSDTSKPLCGFKPKNKTMQWCSKGITLEYIECEKCKKKGGEIIQSQMKKK